MLKLTNTELTAKLIEGDEQAFSALFNQYYSDLVLFAHTFLRNRQSAEEIVQDVFMKLWENRRSLIIISSLKSFLLKSVQNRCIDLIRHNRVKNQTGMPLNSSLFENDTEHYILYSELEKQLEKALKELPEELSWVFRMNRFEGKTYSEIAEAGNVSVRTIEVRIGRALALLRDKLKDYLILLIAACLLLAS